MQIVKLGSVKEHSYTMRESLRGLKTNLQFCGDDIKTILVTSSVPDEGKSTVAMNLARSLTESGKSVLVVDTDMRKSVLIGRLRAKSHEGELYGLSHYLSGQKKLDEVIYATDLKKLFMVFAGPSVPNPTEILEKKYFETLVEFARDHFDYVLFDCAPIGAAIDAAVVAKHCDGAVLVIAQGIASARLINNVKGQLERSGIRILGAVLNKVQMKKNGYGYGYSYTYGYGYYGNAEEEKGLAELKPVTEEGQKPRKKKVTHEK